MGYTQKDTQETDPLATVSVAAAWLGVRASFLVAEIRREKMPVVKWGKRAEWRIRVSDILEYKRKREGKLDPEGEKQRQEKEADGVLLRIKGDLRAVIPEDFEWWFEMDNEVSLVVRFRWKGYFGVMHKGSVSYCDYSILCELLRTLDWEEQRRLALGSVDAREAVKLAALQQQREVCLLSEGRETKGRPGHGVGGERPGRLPEATEMAGSVSRVQTVEWSALSERGRATA